MLKRIRPFIIPTLVLLLVLSTAWQRATRERDTRELVNEIKIAMCGDIPIDQCNLSDTVRQIINNSNQNTILLCKQFRSAERNNLSREDIQEIENICKREVQNAQPTPPPSSNQNQNSKPNSANTNTTTQNPDTNNPGAGNGGGGSDDDMSPLDILNPILPGNPIGDGEGLL